MEKEVVFQELQDFLTKISSDQILSILNIDDIALNLKTKSAISDADHEKIQTMGSNTEKRLCLFTKILPLKTPKKVVAALREISKEQDICRLSQLIEETFRGAEQRDTKANAASTSSKVSENFREAIQYLKRHYEKTSEVMKEHWSNLMDYPEEFTLDDMYVELEIKSEGRREHKPTNTYQDLFGIKSKPEREGHDAVAEAENRRFRKIVLEGDPGMGKTTYVHRLVQLWSRGSWWINQEFDLVLVVKLGNVKPGKNIMDHVPVAGKFKDAIIDFIMDPVNHDRILFVLDAFDEMPANCYHFENLMRKQQLEMYYEKIHSPVKLQVPVGNITLLISTRISHSKHKALKENDSLVRTCGFNLETVKEKLSKKIKNLDSLTTQNNMVNLLKNPLFVGMAISLGEIPGELFHLMEKFCNTAIERYWQRNNIQRSSRDQARDQILRFLGKVAFVILAESDVIAIKSEEFQQVFALLKDEIDIHPEAISKCWNVGLLWPNKLSVDIHSGGGGYEQSGLARINNSSFPHQLFAEYMAAYISASLGFLDYLHNSASVALSPFSYFLSALSPRWKELLLERSAENGTFHCPWTHEPNEESVRKATFSKQVITEIEGNYIPNLEALVRAMFCKKEQFSAINHFHSLTFDEVSCNLLSWTNSKNIYFHKCAVSKDSMKAFRDWMEQQDLHTIVIDENAETNITIAISLAITHCARLHTIAFRDCSNIAEPETCKEIRQILENAKTRASQVKCKVVVENTVPNMDKFLSRSARRRVSSQLTAERYFKVAEVKLCWTQEPNNKLKIINLNADETSNVMCTLIPFLDKHKASTIRSSSLQNACPNVTMKDCRMYDYKERHLKLNILQKLFTGTKENRPHSMKIKTHEEEDVKTAERTNRILLASLSREDNLETFVISKCQELANSAKLFKVLSVNLASLDVSYCELNSSSITALLIYISTARKLMQLIACGNECISHFRDFPGVVLTSPTLRMVDVRNCNLSERFVDALLRFVRSTWVKTTVEMLLLTESEISLVNLENISVLESIPFVHMV